MTQETRSVTSQRERCPNCDRRTLKRPHGSDHVNCVSCNKTFKMDEKPTVVLHDSIELSDKISAHIKVLDGGGEWVGDFWVNFEHRPRRDRSDRYVADWDTIKSGGNGRYVDDDPCFWMVESIVSELRKRYAGMTFQTVDSGKNDK